MSDSDDSDGVSDASSRQSSSRTPETGTVLSIDDVGTPPNAMFSLSAQFSPLSDSNNRTPSSPEPWRNSSVASSVCSSVSSSSRIDSSVASSVCSSVAKSVTSSTSNEGSHVFDEEAMCGIRKFSKSMALSMNALKNEAKKLGLVITMGCRGKNRYDTNKRVGFGVSRKLRRQSSVKIPTTLFSFNERYDGMFYPGRHEFGNCFVCA